MRALPVNLTLLALIAACGRYETGIDRSVLRGTVTLAPESLSEGEAALGANDETALAMDLGYITYRPYIVSGSCLEFDNFSGSPSGDLDWYVFSPQTDGLLPITLDYDSDEGIFFSVVVYDLDAVDADGNPTAIAGGLTTDAFGAYYVEADVVAGGNYGVLVGGTRNPNEAPPDYTLTLWAFDPNGVDFLVGAYAEEDPFARTNPLGGTSLSTFTWDEASMSWTGEYEVLFIRSLVTSYTDPETEEGRTDVVDEAIPSVWMHAGSYSSLNSAILAGNSYATTAVQVTLSTDDAEQDIHEGIALVIDETQPIQIGWEFSETEPNDVELDGTNYVLIGDVAGANVTPTASGLGYVDIISGAVTYATDDPEWAGDNDVFALPADEALNAVVTLEWDDAAADVDLLIFNDAGELIAYAASAALPEVAILGDFGASTAAGGMIYFQVLGWSGTAGDKNYTLSLEYSTF